MADSRLELRGDKWGKMSEVWRRFWGAAHAFLWPPLGITAIRIPHDVGYELLGSENGKRRLPVTEGKFNDGTVIDIPDGGTAVVEIGDRTIRVRDMAGKKGERDEGDNFAYVDEVWLDGDSVQYHQRGRRKGHISNVKWLEKLAQLRDGETYNFVRGVEIEYTASSRVR